MLLEICVPTFNRSEKVKKMLNFLISEIEPFNGEVGIHVKDNNSSDNTYNSLIENYNNIPNLRITKNITNVGLIRNLMLLIDESSGQYTWLVGDDDSLHSGIVKEVLSAINTGQPNLIFINHEARYENNQIVFSSALPKKKDIDLLDVFNFSFGSVMFISASVYKTKIIKGIIKPMLDSASTPRLSSPLYWALKAGSKNKLFFINKVLITNIWGETSWKKEQYKVAIFNIPTEITKVLILDYSKIKVIMSLLKYYYHYSIKFLRKFYQSKNL